MNIVKPIPWLAPGAIVALACTAFAQPVPPSSSGLATVTLAAAVESAWQRAVQSTESAGRLRRAQAEQTAASSLWAAPPSLELSHRDDRWHDRAGRRETEIGIAWPLWLPGQRSARGAAAQAELELARVSQQAARLRIAGEAREAAWGLLALQAEAAQAEALVKLLQTIANDTDRRVKAGDLARADSLAASAEVLAAAAAHSDALQRLHAARSRWTLLTGLDQQPAATEPEGSTNADAALHPELLLAAQATERARKRIDVVRASQRDAPELSLGYRHDVPGRSDATQHSIGIGLRMPFGTSDRNQPLQAAALSELELAQAEEQRLRERQAAEATTARAALAAVRQQLDAERARANLLRERASLIDKSFRAGEGSLPELLRALTTAAQADASAARAQAGLGLARARLLQVLGVMP